MFLPAIEGYVPVEMVRALSAFLDFCYLVRHDSLDDKDIDAVRDALARFARYRVIFQETGVREEGPKGLSLPRAHSMDHYPLHISEFGAPNGLCSSITESKHIVAVKKPWRRSSKWKALGQMLLTNQRLSKLAASRVDFASRGMLEGTVLSAAYEALLAAAASNVDLPNAEDDHGNNSGEPQRNDDHESFNRATELRREAQADLRATDGPRVQNNVVLARTKRECWLLALINKANTYILSRTKIPCSTQCPWSSRWCCKFARACFRILTRSTPW